MHGKLVEMIFVNNKDIQRWTQSVLRLNLMFPWFLMD